MCAVIVCVVTLSDESDKHTLPPVCAYSEDLLNFRLWHSTFSKAVKGECFRIFFPVAILNSSDEKLTLHRPLCDQF